MTTSTPNGVQSGSFLIADCGTTNTTVALFDATEVGYRFVARASAPTTANPPWSDISRGVTVAIQKISDITGRTLLTKSGSLIRPARSPGMGIDHFSAVISAANPLKTLLVGLFDEVSLASARRALSRIYVDEVDHFHLGDERSPEAQIAELVHTQPDLIFVVGGTDGGADKRLLRLLDVVGFGADLLAATKRPRVIYAGNASLRDSVRQLIGASATLQIASNVRPDLATEDLDEAGNLISELYEDLKVNALPGMRELHNWSSRSPMPTAQAFAAMIEYFATVDRKRVLGVDLGSDSVTVVAAGDGQRRLTTRSQLGMGRPIRNVLRGTRAATIAGWMPVATKAGTVYNYIYNKSVHPQIVPANEHELQLEEAIAREILRRVVRETAARWGRSLSWQLPVFDRLVVRGSTLASAPRPGHIMLVLLDALQPTGIFSVALDRYGILPALGSIVTHEPLAVVQSLEDGVLTELGWVVAPAGKGQAGQKVMTVVMESASNKRIELEVTYGALEILPLSTGESATVTLKPTRRFDIGDGPGQARRLTLQGGMVGLVVDARGRPLHLPDEPEARQALMQKWLWDIGA